MRQELLEIRGGIKKNAEEYMLRDISLYIYEGETISICGLHGSGKTTLARVMSGMTELSQGEIYWKEKLVKAEEFPSSENILKKKVCHIHDLESFYDFSVCDYIFSMRSVGLKKILYNRRAAMIQTRNLLKESGILLDPMTLMDDLNRWERLMLEILKCAVYGGNIIILNEVASEFGADILEPFLENMKKRYALSFVYISDAVDMMAKTSDRVYIMQEQTLVYMSDKRDREQFTMDKVLSQYGEDSLYKQRQFRSEEILMDTAIISPVGEEIPLQVRKGEIVGVLDLDGKMRSRLLDHYLHDQLKHTCVKGVKTASYRKMMDMGVYIISEKEQKEGFFPGLSVKENVLISSYRRYGKAGFVNRKLGNYLWTQRILPVLSQEEDGELSAVNRVKVLLLRKLILNPQVLILDNLTLYLDRVERQEVLRFVSEIAEEGTGIIMISSNLPEVYSICDRILILQGQGRWKFFERSQDKEDIK